MKKNGILNSSISKVLADLGHTDTIVIVDSGYPVPKGALKIDLTLKVGTPSFLEVLEIINDEMFIESATIAEEIKISNPIILNRINMYNYKMKIVSHEKLKENAKSASAFIRTGEATPFANIILSSAVFFGDAK